MIFEQQNSTLNFTNQQDTDNNKVDDSITKTFLGSIFIDNNLEENNHNN